MLCSECGHELEENARSCSLCGMRVKKAIGSVQITALIGGILTAVCMCLTWVSIPALDTYQVALKNVTSALSRFIPSLSLSLQSTYTFPGFGDFLGKLGVFLQKLGVSSYDLSALATAYEVLFVVWALALALLVLGAFFLFVSRRRSIIVLLIGCVSSACCAIACLVAISMLNGWLGSSLASMLGKTSISIVGIDLSGFVSSLDGINLFEFAPGLICTVAFGVLTPLVCGVMVGVRAVLRRRHSKGSL